MLQEDSPRCPWQNKVSLCENTWEDRNCEWPLGFNKAPADSPEEHRDFDPRELNSVQYQVNLEADAEFHKGMEPRPTPPHSMQPGEILSRRPS